MPRNPYANTIVATYVIKKWRETESGAEVKTLRTVLRKYGNGTKATGFEKRKFWGREGHWFVGNQMTLNAEDIQFIMDHGNEILETLDMSEDTLDKLTRSEEVLPNGQVKLDGKIYDIDKFYPKK